MYARTNVRTVLLAAAWLILACPSFAQETEPVAGTGIDSDEPDVVTATVVIDGETLFSVRGFRTLPASKRAATIASRIRDLAGDHAFDPDSLQLMDGADGTSIGSPEHRVMRVTSADADMEGIDRRLIAEAYRDKIRAAIVSYRADRTRAALWESGKGAALATVLALIPFLLLRWLFRLYDRWEAKSAEKVKSVSIRSFEVLGAGRIWALVRGSLRVLLALLLTLVVVIYLQHVLSLFPWTRGVGTHIRGWLIAPFAFLVQGVVGALPNVVFLTILVIVIRYLLQLLDKFFHAVGRGEVSLKGFYPEWAGPTFSLIRFGVVMLALVIAYPYIPGSSSEAFKGVSIFAAALFSLGSTSVIANIVAGYTMVYRHAFDEGDVVKIGSVIGVVANRRLQVTHLRTVKNEEIIIPNSTILNSEITNYSSAAKGEGVILHTTVSIGYETPWRQVEALLLEAAARTEGFMKTPPPFVRYLTLGDFAITYEINAYCKQARDMFKLYSAIHSNILDLFNEHGVQIMTPAYEGDPDQPKVVPPERWHLPPAT